MKRTHVVARALAASGMVAGVTAAGVAGLATTGAQPAAAQPVAAAITPTPSSSCALGNNVSHVIEITFDNVHFNRDNPNVPSDVEQLPALENFIRSNGTLLSNNHTPLIAHTADDTITNYSGLYGDRQGLGITNSYNVYNSTQTSAAKKSAFAYWTANYGLSGDPYPNQPYSANVPAAGAAPATPPAPWVPYTKAGCDFGAVSTSNMELENTNPDLANVFGAGSPEVNQYNADHSLDSFNDQETNDYVGLGVHCGQVGGVNDSFCTTATATKYGQSSPSNTAVTDSLPNEPGGYSNYQAVFGSRYLTPQLVNAANSGGNRVVNGHTYPVYDSGGALTDLNGTEIDGGFKSEGPNVSGPSAFYPGFPGFSYITAAQSLAYVADMQEVGVPVTYAYISDLHQKFPTQGSCGSPGATSAPGNNNGAALGPGDVCYEQSAQAYNSAFATFFQRLADDGMTPQNTEFIFTADEGDHFAGANVGRAATPSCTGTPGTAIDLPTGNPTPYECTYASGQLGEVATDIHGLLNLQTSDTASFYSQPQGEAVYVTSPSNTTSSIRQLEHDFAGVTMVDPYDNASTAEPVTKWEVDPNTEALLHFVNADPNRTPSFTVWPNADVFFTDGTTDSCPSGTSANAATSCNPLNSAFAWNHGYYQPEVDNTWLGLVGPGVCSVNTPPALAGNCASTTGLDGTDASGGPSSSDGAAGGSQLVSQLSNPGTWADHTDIRPTILALVGLKDDYVGDGRVLIEDLYVRPGQTSDPNFLPLAKCYKQMNSSVGQFGSDIIKADTAAVESGSSTNDTTYQAFQTSLQQLGAYRDTTATAIKNELWNAEFTNTPLPASQGSDHNACSNTLIAADALAAGQSLPPILPEAPWAAALPLGALAVIGGAMLVRRRRRQANAV